MSTPKQAAEAPDTATAIDKLTDDALRNEVSKLTRMIGTRETARDTLDNEIGELRKRRDVFIQAQIDRLKDQMSPVEKEGEKIGRAHV